MWFAPSKSQSTPLLPDKWEALITRSGIECVFPFFFLFIPYYRGGTIIECSEKVAVRWKFLANFGWVELSSMIIFEDSIVASSNLLRSASALGPWKPATTQVRPLEASILILWGHVVLILLFWGCFLLPFWGALNLTTKCLLGNKKGAEYILDTIGSAAPELFLINFNHQPW